MSVPTVDCVIWCCGRSEERIWSAAQDYALQTYPQARRRLVVQGASEHLAAALMVWGSECGESVALAEGGSFLVPPDDTVAADIVVPWDPDCRHYCRRVETQVGYLGLLEGPLVCAPDLIVFDVRDGSTYVLDAAFLRRCQGASSGVLETLTFRRDAWPAGRRAPTSYQDLYDALSGQARPGCRLVIPGLPDRVATLVRLVDHGQVSADAEFLNRIRDHCLDARLAESLADFLSLVLARLNLTEACAPMLVGRGGVRVGFLSPPSEGPIEPLHDV